MVSARRPLVAGNWKMNGLKASTAELGKIMAGSAGLSGKIDLMVCRKRRHQVLLSGFYHDDLGMMPGFHVLGLGDPLCRDSFGMMQNLVTNLIVVQTIDKLFWYFHERLQMETITFPRYLYFGEAV